MQQRIKDIFSDSFMNYNTFTKEIYKKVRNNGKKLDIIYKIEEKLENGQPINHEQREKLQHKEGLE